MMTNMVITSYGKSDDFKFYYSSIINRSSGKIDKTRFNLALF